jgi:hypothetical protein
MWFFAAAWLVVRALSAHDAGPPVCVFRRITGYPCATCGATRATAKLLRGDWTDAFALNPLMSALLVVTPVAIIVAWLTRNRLPQLSQRGWHLLGWAVLALVLANWAYVIVAQRG